MAQFLKEKKKKECVRGIGPPLSVLSILTSCRQAAGELCVDKRDPSSQQTLKREAVEL
jgi:hypothetical protein